MKKYYFIFISLVSLMYTSVTSAAMTESELKESIIPNSGRNTVSSTEQWAGLLDYTLWFLRDSIFALMALLAIGMFLFIGGRLVVARWNPEEFKKALQSFIYAVVGIFFVAFAYAVVTLVAGINI